MIRVTFKGPEAPEPRNIDADHISLYDSGWAVLYKNHPVEVKEWPDPRFIEAIRLDKIDSIVRVDP